MSEVTRPTRTTRTADERRPSVGAVRAATGREWEDWFAQLDAWGAVDRRHGEITAWLAAEHGVASWWTQSVAVEYERARGLRAYRGNRDGLFSGSASRTVDTPVERLFAAFVEPGQREQWLPGAPLRERTTRPARSARYDWADGATRVLVGFEAKGAGRSQVAVVHERLGDAEAAGQAKAYWRDALAALKAMLEDRIDPREA